MDLRNATALVTGGSSGIGYAVAKLLIESGARVAVVGRNQQKLSTAAESLGAVPIRANVADEADVRLAYEEVLRRFGHLDILVNNAGIGIFRNLIDMDRESFEAVFAVNVTGAMLMAREAARHFVQRQSGNIVNIGQTAALRGAPRGSAYYASKFALRGMTECWRTELRRHNVRVVLINPSEVLTMFGEPAGAAPADDPSKLHAEDIAHMVKAVLEMENRGFTPELSIFATNPTS